MFNDLVLKEQHIKRTTIKWLQIWQFLFMFDPNIIDVAAM